MSRLWCWDNMHSLAWESVSNLSIGHWQAAVVSDSINLKRQGYNRGYSTKYLSGHLIFTAQILFQRSERSEPNSVCRKNIRNYPWSVFLYALTNTLICVFNDIPWPRTQCQRLQEATPVDQHFEGTRCVKYLTIPLIRFEPISFRRVGLVENGSWYAQNVHFFERKLILHRNVMLLVPIVVPVWSMLSEVNHPKVYLRSTAIRQWQALVSVPAPIGYAYVLLQSDCFLIEDVILVIPPNLNARTTLLKDLPWRPTRTLWKRSKI